MKSKILWGVVVVCGLFSMTLFIYAKKIKLPEQAGLVKQTEVGATLGGAHSGDDHAELEAVSIPLFPAIAASLPPKERLRLHSQRVREFTKVRNRLREQVIRQPSKDLVLKFKQVTELLQIERDNLNSLFGEER